MFLFFKHQKAYEMGISYWSSDVCSSDLTPPVFVEHEYLSDENLLNLQTFPRSWYLHGTRMERAFQIGNAVPPILARAIGEALITAMGINVEVEEKEEDVVARNVACI